MNRVVGGCWGKHRGKREHVEGGRREPGISDGRLLWPQLGSCREEGGWGLSPRQASERPNWTSVCSAPSGGHLGNPIQGLGASQGLGGHLSQGQHSVNGERVIVFHYKKQKGGLLEGPLGRSFLGTGEAGYRAGRTMVGLSLNQFWNGESQEGKAR